jgi:hypothetical protein
MREKAAQYIQEILERDSTKEGVQRRPFSIKIEIA